MTISTTTARVKYNGSGSTGPFSVPFYWTATTELVVTKTVDDVESTLAETTGYTATGSGTDSGSITLVTALESGETLVIERVTLKTQSLDLERASLDPELLESALDKQTRQVQDLWDRVTRSVFLYKDDTDGSGAINTRGNRIANIGDATEDDDAVALGQLSAWVEPTFEIGTVTTGAAGSSAEALITGTAPDFTLDLTIPRGNTGASGAGTGDLLAAQNLADLASAATARTNLGLAIGTNVQAYAANLTSWAALATSAKLDAASYTAADVLTKLLTVDGAGSTLDADLLDGISSAAFAQLASAQAWTKAQRGTPVALTSSAASIAVDASLGNNFSHTFTENTTLANPTNIVAGQSGFIVFTQHASSPKTLAFGSYWKFSGGSAPTVTASNSAVDILAYYVEDSTRISATLLTNMS